MHTELIATRGFNELIEAIYEAALAPEHWQAVLQKFGRLFNSDVGGLLHQHHNPANVSFCLQQGIPEDMYSQYLTYYKDLNVWQPHMASLPEAAVSHDGPSITGTTLERTEFYCDWLRPQDLMHTMGANILKDKRGAMQATVLRSKRLGHYRPEELYALKRLVPHFRRAMQVHRELFAVQTQRNGALQGLDALALGVIVASADARILFCNKSAERILSAGECLSVAGGRLRTAHAEATQSLHQLIYEAAATAAGNAPVDAAGGGLLALPSVSEPPMSALVAPLKGDDDLFPPQCPAAIVLVTKGRRHVKIRPEDLTRLYGLTHAEARLACGLVEGLSVQDYADANEITATTARTQLKQVFAKAGVNRQSALMRLVLQNPVLSIAAWRTAHE